MTENIEPKQITAAQPKPWLEQKLFAWFTPALLILALIVLVSLGFHLHNLDAIGDANTYYTAAVEAMLDSWSNFFFVAAEPGGSVTVDKPPLGLWMEAAFAFVFGVNGIAVSMPNILAGLFSIPLMYYLVKKYLGAGPGLAAAAVMAFTPVAFAADRNNTMDSMLTFTLLLAAWAFIVATERGQLRYLLLGGLIIGLGFNIKMMQAFLPLPAFFALYFFASKHGWGRKLFNLGLTTLVIAVVSLSWALAVDAVPADQRPYIGSSTDNTVMELIVGHNGLNRLFGGGGNRQTAENLQSPQDGDGQPVLPQSQTGQRPAGPPDGNPTGQFPASPPDQGGQAPAGQSGGAFSDEIGSTG
ncbi:MAG TPA: glycosyltransferase family 39 protein, partial [Anaerolineales bacterium]|nr:glycosyltransferase family 39 protein [Anaerolineales bacterium]